MKKYLALLAALTLLTATACFGPKAPPSGASDMQSDDSQAQASDTAGQPDDGDTVSVSLDDVLAGGRTDLSQLSPAERQALIDAGKDNGVRITFNADGSATFTNEDGTTTTQNPDGTWMYTGENGDHAQIGGNWPSNEFTKMIPKPDFGTMLTAAVTDGEFTASFLEVKVEQVRDYAQKVKAAGFSANPEVTDQALGELVVYEYSAEKGERTVSVVYSFGTMVITLR